MIEYTIYFRDVQINMNYIKEHVAHSFVNRYKWALWSDIDSFDPVAASCTIARLIILMYRALIEDYAIFHYNLSFASRGNDRSVSILSSS